MRARHWRRLEVRIVMLYRHCKPEEFQGTSILTVAKF